MKLSLFTTCLLTSLACVCADPCAGVNPGKQKKLLAYWNFDEGKGTDCRDRSGNGHHLRIDHDMRGVKWVPGKKGTALHFSAEKKGEKNQAGGATTTGRFSYDLTNGFSIECWVKMDENADWSRRVYHVITNSPGNYGPGFILYYNWRHYMLLSGPGGKNGSQTHWKVTAPVTDLRGKWVHLAATFDGKHARIYINGQCSAESGKEVTYHGREKLILTIGSGWKGLSNGFPGIIDEVKIFNYARTPTDIIRTVKLNL